MTSGGLPSGGSALSGVCLLREEVSCLLRGYLHGDSPLPHPETCRDTVNRLECILVNEKFDLNDSFGLKKTLLLDLLKVPWMCPWTLGRCWDPQTPWTCAHAREPVSWSDPAQLVPGCQEPLKGWCDPKLGNLQQNVGGVNEIAQPGFRKNTRVAWTAQFEDEFLNRLRLFSHSRWLNRPFPVQKKKRPCTVNGRTAWRGRFVRRQAVRRLGESRC